MWLCSLVFAAPAPIGQERLAWALRQEVAFHQDPEWVSRQLREIDPSLARVVVELEPGVVLPEEYVVEAAPGDGRIVQVRAPYTSLVALSNLPGVTRVRSPWRARAKEEVSEGYAATMLQDWHKEGFDGAGVSIGVIDVGFQGLDTLDSELPQAALLDDSRGYNNTDHGAAVTEIIYDYAPKADYYLATFSTDVELCAILEDMIAAEVQIVNGSIGFDNLWHTDGSSLLSRCVDGAVELGITYVAAAGNEANKYRIGELAWQGDDGTVAIEGESAITLSSFFGEVDVSFRWSEPMDGASTDLDLWVYNEDGTVCGRSEEPQSGYGYPVELVQAAGCSDLVTAVVVSEDDPSGLTGYFYSAYGIPKAMQTGDESLTLPGDARGAITVGAWSAVVDEVPSWSSRGPTYDGRVKPDLIAPTAVTTATYGYRQFEGTSAATPHATGLAALWTQATRERGDPAALKAWMTEEARDFGNPGPDNLSGHGVLTADALPEVPCGCGGGKSVVWVLGAGLGLARLRRRARTPR